MATRRYKISAGEVGNQVVEEVGAATNSDSVELTVDLAGAGITTAAGRERVIIALEHIKNHILAGKWPPA